MFRFIYKWTSAKPPKRYQPLSFTNTLSGTKEQFDAPTVRPVRMYNCGPTVYDKQHIGNISMYVFVDVLRRVLEYNGLNVKQVINITDVGHLTSDADEGEDKMSAALKRENKDLTLENMRELGEHYTTLFVEDLKCLNIKMTHTEFPRASDYISAQIAMIQTLEEKGYAYKTSDGVYFDTSMFPTYGKLGGINLEKLKEGARVEANPEKHHPADFALWKNNAQLGWESPWGKGFPGWHIECSAMARSLLGEQIDIHTGGIEHIPVHHNNEIAQSEAATGKRPFSRLWLHRAHLQLDGRKIAKSEGNAVYLSDIMDKGFHPLAFRYWLLGSHYRTPANFTWEAVQGAEHALLHLHHMRSRVETNERGTVIESYEKRFHERINDDLDTAGALAVVWDLVKDSEQQPSDILATLRYVDCVLGLELDTPSEELTNRLREMFGEYIEMRDAPKDIQSMVTEREAARKEKNWSKADSLREEIESKGFAAEDTSSGTKILKKGRADLQQPKKAK